MPPENHQIEQEDLIAGLKDRDAQSMSYLVNNYSAAIFGVISRIVSNDSVAQEVLQDAFMKFWEKIDQYDPSKGRLFTWMMNISRNLAIDKLRSREIKKNEKTDDISNYVIELGERSSLSQNIDVIGIRETLANLREEEKFVLEMTYFKGYTQSEIADEFEIPLGTVKTRLRMAIKHLREFLKE